MSALHAIPVECPSWCDNGERCDGQHYGPVASVPASGGGILWHAVHSHWTAAHVPVVTVRSAHSVIEGDCHDGASVVLHVHDADHGEHEAVEVEVNLRPSEARALVAYLSGCLSELGEVER